MSFQMINQFLPYMCEPRVLLFLSLQFTTLPNYKKENIHAKSQYYVLCLCFSKTMIYFLQQHNRNDYSTKHVWVTSRIFQQKMKDFSWSFYMDRPKYSHGIYLFILLLSIKAPEEKILFINANQLVIPSCCPQKCAAHHLHYILVSKQMNR